MSTPQTVPQPPTEHRPHSADRDSDPPGGAVSAAPRTAAVRAALVPPVVGLLIGSLFVAVFLAAFHDPKPRGLPVAVVAPAAVLSMLQSQAGSDDGPLEVRAYADRGSAEAAVRERTVLGAFVASASGPELLVAGANGPAVSQTLQGVFGAATQATGTPLRTTDVTPLSSGDSRGLSIFYGAFGVVLAGFLFGLTSMQFGPELALRWRAASAVTFAVVVGLVVAWLLQPVFGSLPAPFATTTAVVALLALTVGATTAALLRVFGPAGTFVAAVVLLVFGNATSTGILPAQYLPNWLEPLSAVLPVGVAVRALRGAAYFDDDGLLSAVLVLTAWVVGATLVFAAVTAKQRRPDHVPAHGDVTALAAVPA